MTPVIDPPTTALQTGHAAPQSATESPRPIIRIALFDETQAAASSIAELLKQSAPVFEVVKPSARDAADSAFLQIVDAALLIDPALAAAASDDVHVRRLNQLLSTLRERRVASVLLTRRPWVFVGHSTGVLCLPPTVSRDMLHGALLAMAHLRAVLRQIDLELTSLASLGEKLSRHFETLDEELRLASRLQHDFLPRDFPCADRLRFSTIFRPCSWVSGDFFDVFALDGDRVGFYLADAMGHGVAAGLLTMFIKNAIQTHRIRDHSREVIPPGEVLARLNEALAQQELPDSQFVTAWYSAVDTASMELRYATGGHPPPLLVNPDGSSRLLTAEGCLLGVFPGQLFSERAVRLEPGQRLVLYSDGLQGLLMHESGFPLGEAHLAPGIDAMLRLPPSEMVSAVMDRLDTQPGGLRGADDASLVMVDVLGPNK